ncbi:undecaprenyldiphospho-muramoylpentapeptide beta-N-acetylglucosaminyltransferase [Schlesneria sp.]|uniref:undecaprenyldiphospho-muramoylpentapeptide beta-N-acetylglucosaminyltransferase n=1 Tax=Schlesneria sp. TaxID=2762018 RepID=UPI002F0A8D41
MEAAPTILFAGGGTGGHLFPGIAVAEQLRQRSPSRRLIFIGSNRPIEVSIAADHHLEHRMLPVESLAVLKRNPVRFLWRNWQAWRSAQALLKELRPAAVIGLGGYASAPLVYAASRQRIPVVLLEQNAIPGRTTRGLSRYANQVCLSFAEAQSYLPRARRVTVTGNPVRAEIARLHHPAEDHADTVVSPVDTGRHLLILGGSQGADSLNAAVLKAVAALREPLANWQIDHQTGPRDVEVARQTYAQLGLKAEVSSFFREMPALYERASLVISRAGATTLAELACAGKPVVLLPYPHAADAHQHANAKVFVDREAALLVEHAHSSDETALQLSRNLEKLIRDPYLRHRMGNAALSLAHPDAAAAIADVIAAEVTPCAR